MNKQAIEKYLGRLWEIYRENTREDFSRYITALTDLLKNVSPGMEPGIEAPQDRYYTGGTFVEALETVPGEKDQKPVDLPQFPGIRIRSDEYKIFGYLEPMNPALRRIDIRLHPMGEVYREVFSNIIFTNFFLFLYYRDKKRVDFARPFQASFIKELTPGSRKDLLEKKTGQLFKILNNFINAADNEEKISSWIEFQDKLALKTFYLRRYVILPFIRKTLKNSFLDKDNPTVNLFYEYNLLFPFHLTEDDFASIITHEIIDGFIRGGLMFNGSSRICFVPIEKYIMEYGDFYSPNKNPLFIYLFKEKKTFPGELKWALDDIASFLFYRVNFKRLGISKMIPWKIAGDSLQWEKYFIDPYYDSREEKTRVKEMLIIRGIYNPGKKRKIISR